MTRTEKAAKNIAFSIFSQLVILLLTFISRSVFIKYLGIEYLGINGLFGDILGLLSMADLGIGTAMVFSFYKPLAEKDNNKIAALTHFYKKMYIFIAFFILIFGLMLIPFLPYLIKLENTIKNLEIYYLLALMNVVISYIYTFKTSVLTADQNGYIISKINTIVSVIKTFTQIVSIVIVRNYIIYLVVGVIFSFVNNYIASKYAEKKYPFIDKKIELSKENKLEIYKNIMSVFIYKVSSVMLSATDNIIISIISGTIFVGLYSNYLLIQNKIILIYSLIFTSLTASVGNLIVTESAKKQNEIFECVLSISFIISAIVVPCYIVLVNDFIKLWLGKEYLLSFSVVMAIGCNMYLSSALQPLWSYREAAGIYKDTKWVMLLCAILNIVLSFVLGEKLGIFGVIIASVISRILTYVWFEPAILYKKYFLISPFRYYISFLKNIFITIVISFIGVLIFNNFNVNSYFAWFVKAIVFGILNLTFVMILYKKTNGFILLENKLNSMIKYKIRKDKI